MDLIIRKAQPADAKAVALLTGQLGYTVSEEQTAQAIAIISNKPEEVILVALHGEDVIGWTHIHYALRLESEAFCEFAGLVVKDGYRGKGVGKLLVNAAREWTISKGIKRLRVRANVKRADAHRFYLNAGFVEIKQQKVFEIDMSSIK
jgi:GNAT superfamily N-acetyltransferase